MFCIAYIMETQENTKKRSIKKFSELDRKHQLLTYFSAICILLGLVLIILPTYDADYLQKEADKKCPNQVIIPNDNYKYQVVYTKDNLLNISYCEVKMVENGN